MDTLDLSNLGLILVVEDDEVCRSEIISWITKLDGTAIPLSSGTHAIKYIQSQNWDWFPSLIVTDIVMDGLGGYEFIRRISELYPNKNIPIIAISKLVSRIDIIEAEAAGANAYLTKPINEETFINSLSRIVNHEKNKPLVFHSA